jgi:hypothetical protein
MRTIILALTAPFCLAGIAAPVAAQSAGPSQTVIEVQANPIGAGGSAAMPPDPANANSPVPAAMPADPSYHGGAYTGALTAPPAAEMNKTYPRCTATVRDACVNPGQATNMRHRAARPAQSE